MEYAGDNCNYLSTKINEKNEPIRSQEVLRNWARQLLSALAHIHEKGYIHQDIKLENVLVKLDSDLLASEIKLVDFGLSGIIKDNSSFMEVKVGTNGYQAPEVVDKA